MVLALDFLDTYILQELYQQVQHTIQVRVVDRHQFLLKPITIHGVELAICIKMRMG